MKIIATIKRRQQDIKLENKNKKWRNYKPSYYLQVNASKGYDRLLKRWLPGDSFNKKGENQRMKVQGIRC